MTAASGGGGAAADVRRGACQRDCFAASAAGEATGLGASGCEADRRGRREAFIRQAVDRLLAEERIDPGIEVEGDQFARVFAVRNSWAVQLRVDEAEVIGTLHRQSLMGEAT